MKRSTILLVDDDPVIIRSISRILAGIADVRFATNGDAALRLARESTPDLVLLDSEMPGMSGFQVCAAFQSDPELAESPIIFVTSHSDTAMHIAGLEAGAVDFIAKPISEPLLLARVKSQLRIKRLTDELRSATMMDQLTQIANRRRFDEKLARECARAARDQEPLSLLMVDVDYFKRFNDHYGHPAGDICLKNIATVLEKSCHRPADLAARYGGEEFTVVLPGEGLEGASHVARRILAVLKALALPHAKSSVSKHVTVSIGIGFFDRVPIEGAEQALLASADKALYAAKSAGRAQAWALDASASSLGEPESIDDVTPDIPTSSTT